MKQNDSRRKIGIFGSVPIFALPKINSVNELKAMVGISSYQGTNENAFPSIPVLAERIGLSPAATSTAVSGLVRKNLVARKRNYGRVNTYYLLYETESKEEIALHNKEEKRKERAARLKQNIQSFESLEYSKVSNDDYSKSSNVGHSKVSNSILKEHLKEHLKEQSKIPITPTLSEQLKDLALKHNLTYSTNPDEQGLFLNKLMRLNRTNEKILEQATRFFEIVKRDPKLNWIHEFSFGFKFLQFKWDNIDAWHNKNKPQVREFKKPESSMYAANSTPPTLEQLERMCK